MDRHFDDPPPFTGEVAAKPTEGVPIPSVPKSPLQHASRGPPPPLRRGGWQTQEPPGFADGQIVRWLPPPEALHFEAPPAAAPPQQHNAPDEALLADLLSLVLFSDAEAVAARAILRFGSFAGVLAAAERDLRTIRGLGTQGIAAVKLVHAAAVRLARAGVIGRPVLDGWDGLIAYLTAVMARERIEQFRILFLDAEGRLRADEAQAKGTVNHTPVYPREVVRRALELDAAAVILVHNHPSGDPAASMEDMEMTDRIREAAAAVGVTVRDHVIIGNGRWLSFQQEGLL